MYRVRYSDRRIIDSSNFSPSLREDLDATQRFIYTTAQLDGERKSTYAMLKPLGGAPRSPPLPRGRLAKAGLVTVRRVARDVPGRDLAARRHGHLVRDPSERLENHSISRSERSEARETRVRLACRFGLDSLSFTLEIRCGSCQLGHAVRAVDAAALRPPQAGLAPAAVRLQRPQLAPVRLRTPVPADTVRTCTCQPLGDMGLNM